jgi:bifunctional non-homologous end joining protein LigD
MFYLIEEIGPNYNRKFMTLKEYRKKRRFGNTPEPLPSFESGDESLRFCVQKHAAFHLHYDFRLELDGVLLSWAIPKGPSLNPKDKRLAIHVEDHPLDYRTFEGVIPKGNYGAGTVLLWDEGTYAAVNASSKSENEKKLREGMKKGHLEIQLFGRKLKGKFNLIELKQSPDKNAWLLIKSPDAYANEDWDIQELDYSVKSSKAKRNNKMPAWIAPMLAKLVDAPFNDENWLFEIKWDGYRVLSFVDKAKVQLYSRNKNSFNSLFPSVVEELKNLNAQVILDGEVVVVDKNGKSSFEQLASFQRNQTGALTYFIFDILFYDGQDLRSLPLMERKERLKKLLANFNSLQIRYNDHVEEKGIEFFKKAVKSKLEGIIGKNKQSVYVSKRSSEWVKIKTALRQEALIGGFTRPKGGRKKFGSLLIGVYDKKGGFEYIGNVGGGFDRNSLESVYSAMQPLIQEKCPFKTIPKGHDVIAWVAPKLICEVSFVEWTADKKMRQPVFHGLRIDKTPKEVVKEVEETSPHDNSNFTHLDKIYWKKEKYTKGDLIAYYQAVAPSILPYLKNRPLMMHRYPNGIEGESFYQKNIQSPPSWMKTASIEHENKKDQYVLVQDERTLLYVANLGSIELHPMISKVNTLDSPDFLVIDLDPEDISFKKVVEVACWIHEFLEELSVPNYCKTSGGRGLHLYIPLGAKYPFDQTEMFAELLAHLVRDRLPSLVSLERMPKNRQKRIYFDYLQNARGGRTMVAPYSLRAKQGAPVSTPLDWKEVNSDLNPLEFNIKTIPSRINKNGDPLKSILNKTINLKSVIKKLEKARA